MSRRDRTLRRLLRRQDLADELARQFPNVTITDAGGAVLFGGGAGDGSAEIVSGNSLIGYVRGDNADDVARLLGLLATREHEARDLARESLDRYKELTMLYSISEKTVGSRGRADIAATICAEAARFLKCDSVAALVMNAGAGRLELVASAGAAFQDRSSRDIGTDVVAAVLDSGTGEIVNDIHADERGLDGSDALQAAICSPMKSGDRVIGVLVAGAGAGREFSAGDLQILNAMAAHCAAAMEVMRLDRDLKATERRPADIIYGLDDRPPPGIAVMLGLQHVLIAMMSMAYPVLVTLEAGGTRLQAASVVSMSLIAMAVATAVQTLRRGPVGSGHLAPYITSAIYLGPGLLAARVGGLGLVFGMTILAGFISLCLSQILRRFRRLFPPEVSGVVVLMVGISMVPVALTRLVGIGGADQVSEPREWLAGLITLATILLFTVLAGRIRLYATAIGLAVGYASAAALGLFEAGLFVPVAELPVFGLLAPTWGDLSIEPLLIIPFVAAALASNVKDAGLLISAQKVNDARWQRPDTGSMSGGLAAGALGNIVAGALGGVGLGVSAGSIGLAAATGATARVIGLVTAAILLILALLPKVTAVLALIPSPVMGAGLIYVACHLVSSGTELIASRMLDARRIYVIGLPLLAGVGIISMPGLADAFPAWAATVIESPLATATILALLLNLILNVGVSNRATTRITLDANLGDAVAYFVDRKGASWGARRDVIDRASPAITDWLEELRETSDAADVDLFFDDFRFIATIRLGANDYSVAERTADTIDHRYGCQHRLAGDGTISLTFEH